MPIATPFISNALTVPAAKKKPKPYDPFQIVPDNVLQQQATSNVTKAYTPLYQQLKDLYDNQATTATNAITGYSKSLADIYKNAAPEADRNYAGAASGLANIGAALSAELKNAGSTEASALAGKLKDLPVDPSMASTLSNVANNAAGANYASGSATLEQLLREGAAARNYAGKLPGIAADQGKQTLANELGAITNNANTAAHDLTAKAAAAGLDELGRLQTLNFNKATAKAAGLTATAKAAAATAKAAAPDASLSKMFGYAVDAYGNAITDKQGNTIPVGTQAKGPKPNASLSKIYGYVVDDQGNPVLQNGKRVPVKTASGGGSGNSAAKTKQLQQFYDEAVSLGRKLHAGGDKPTSTGTGGGLAGAIAGATGTTTTSAPVPFKRAYQQVYAYFLGQGVKDATYARRQTLRALAAAGYPVRADLIPQG